MKQLFQTLIAGLPSLPTAPPAHAPNRATLIQMAAVIALALIMHFSIASLSIAVLSCVVFALKCLIIWGKKDSPPQWLMMILAIISLGLIIISYGGWNGQTAGISFLVLLVSLKFLESKTVRDYFVVCVILYFLTASSFLFNSSLANIALVIAYTITITALLFKITNPAKISLWSAVKSASGLILKALPLAVFLFFFFPRLQGGFGFIPSLDKNTNALDNALVAGEMANSAFNNELAFTAKFSGAIPSNSRLYWRAKVMTEEVDFTWLVSQKEVSKWQNLSASREIRNQSKLAPVGQTEYEITHEYSTDIFVPYLDYVKTNELGLLNYDYSVFIKRPKGRAFRYKGTSSLKPWFTPQALNTDSLLVTKSQPTARTQALISSIRQSANTPRQIANAVYSHFANNPYNYSLTPPVLEDIAPLDDFLFNTRTGYCEHYASAFTTLLRWAGVPARVVTGYQGGAINQKGGFLEVRYSDAHAWSEAYIDGNWVRYDPTAAISPERIEYGMGALRELWENDLLGDNASGRALSNFLNPTGTARIWRNVLETWSNAKYQWKKWVIDYDSDTQQELLGKLGFSAKNGLYSIVVILSIGVIAILLLYFWQLVPKPIKRSNLQKTYLAFTTKTKKTGVIRNKSETPNEFARRLIQAYPAKEAEIKQITNLYQELCYGQKSLDAEAKLQQLKSTIRSLRLRKTHPSKKSDTLYEKTA